MSAGKVLLVMVCVVLIAGAAFARESPRPRLIPNRPMSAEESQASVDPGLRGLYEEAAVDTYTIVHFTFESMSWQGWTRVDNTAQPGTFFHVDNFAGLGSGFYGLLVPLEGTKSMWCGARPNPSDQYLCAFEKLPGYGNSWDQSLTTGPLAAVGAVTWSFKISYDSEPDYDYTRIEYDAGGHWTSVADYSGRGTADASFFIPIQTVQTKLRFHFVSDGAWSDEDGLWNTDGGCIVDDITVHDIAGYNNYENFEAADSGATTAGIWTATVKAAYGRYSGLRTNLMDKDPCGDNFGTQVVFFVGSTVPSADYPGLYETPYCKGATFHDYPCQDEGIISPVIDMTKYSTGDNEIQDAIIPPAERAKLGGTIFRFTVYRDLPLPNLIFYQWSVRKVGGGCRQTWMDRDFGYYGPDQQYVVMGEDVTDLVGGDGPIQIYLGVVDMCGQWYLQNGNCAAHTPTPWFDNVRVVRYSSYGPQLSYRDLDLFQDNFPTQSAPPWGTVRADAANDLRANNVSGIDPGDSIVVRGAYLFPHEIDTMPNGLPAVFMHVKAHWIGAGAPPLGETIHGAQLQGTYGLWANTDGGGWDIIQMDYARVGKEHWVVSGTYAADLNDSLFVPGYIIEYYFTASNNAGVEKALPKWARSRGPYFEFTCLPTGNTMNLYVDDCHGRGSWNGAADDYWTDAFRAVRPVMPDRYDVNGPTSAVSNGLGSRASAALLRYMYCQIIWDSGDLEDITISDGRGGYDSDKSPDCQVLDDWMSQSPHLCGLWVCGDGVAYDLTVNDGLYTPARVLMQDWCGVTLVNTSYFDVTGGRFGGGVINPLVTGLPGSVFYEGGIADTWYVYGGCPTINQFDCLGTTASGVYAAKYPDYEGAPYYGAVQSEKKNAQGQWIRTMWFGFGFQYIRDDNLGAPQDQFEIVQDVCSWMNAGGSKPNFTGADVPAAYGLSQNYPNPFNPMTTIKYDIKEKGAVTVKVYNVAGQLVRTLVNGTKDAGSYAVTWNGKNERGARVASGIYFYKMETKGYSATKKLVLMR